MTKGFTLIETLLYLALYAILMTGIFVGMFAIIESQDRDATSALLEEEGDFLLEKIEWTLSGAQSIDQPNDSGSRLRVTDADGSMVSIWSDDADVRIQEGNGVASTLNSNAVSVTDLLFFHDNSDSSQNIEASFVLHATTSEGRPISRDFSTLYYLSS